MASWVYVFSKFTPEALLFEALAICILVCAYAAFWILRRIKLGTGAEAIPASVVRDALNQLIGDAESLRGQLFGILSGAEGAAAVNSNLLASLATRSSLSAPAGAGIGASDPDVLRKLAQLEAKMAEQTLMMEKIQAEKLRLEQELALAKGAGAGGTAGASGNQDEKIKMLEARLAEYSVIEDDLANLKRLQQENAQLKANLANAGIAAPTAAVEAAPAIPATDSAKAPIPEETALAKPAAEPEPAPAPELAAETSDVPTPQSVAEAAPITALQSSAPNSTEPDFETLVDSVEQSLQKPEAQPPAEAAAPAAVSEKPASTSPEKSDEDLIAEFEKMLNS